MQVVKKWIRVSRANFIPVAVFPYSVGAAFACRDVPFRLPEFVLGLFGGALVLLGACLFNEYWDYRFGADLLEDGRHPHFGGSKAIQEGIVPSAAVRRAARLCLGVAVTLGGVLALFLQSWPLAILVLGASGIAWAYTAPPLALIYRGWGELALFVAFGPLLVSGGYLLQAGTVTMPLVLLSISPGLITAAVLMANEFGDAAADTRAGKKNLLVRTGPRRTFFAFRCSLVLAYALPVAGSLAGVFPTLFLLIPVSFPLALRVMALLGRELEGRMDFEASSARMILLYNVFHIVLIGCIIFS